MGDEATGLYRKGPDDKKETMFLLLDLTAFITEGFAEMRRAGASLWGVYSCYNLFFMIMKPITHDLRFICGAFFGEVNHQSLDMMAIMTAGEDFKRTFKAYLGDRSVVRFNLVAVRAIHNKGIGVMLENRTKEGNDRNFASASYWSFL